MDDNRFVGKYNMENSCIGAQDEELLNWFNEKGVSILNKYFKESAKLDYKKDKNGVMVKIITKNLMIIPRYDKDLLELINSSVFFDIQRYKRGKVQILLWFRG